MDLSHLDQFSSQHFFDTSEFKYKDIIDSRKLVWEVIQDIPQLIQELFDSGRVKGNYAKDVYIFPTATIDKAARIIGPSIIGQNVRVDFNAYIHGNVIIDDNAVIGSASEIKNSILLNTVKASHFNYVSDSLLGNSVRLGAGAVIANKRIDRGTIKIKMTKDLTIDTGSTRFGTIIGDNSRVGANSVINPGTIIGKQSLIYPLTSVTGVHKDKEVMKNTFHS